MPGRAKPCDSDPRPGNIDLRARRTHARATPRRMRKQAAVVLVVLGMCVTRAHARGPSTPTVPLEPQPEGQTSTGMLLLRSPGADEILIREGTFTMGSSAEEISSARALCQAEPMATSCADTRFSEEFPDHEVFLSTYWIQRTEVTVAQYRRCVAAGQCLEPPYASGATRFDQPDFSGVGTCSARRQTSAVSLGKYVQRSVGEPWPRARGIDARPVHVGVVVIERRDGRQRWIFGDRSGEFVS